MTLAAITMTAPEAASPVQMYRATYSPDDNKLRLYAVSRLDSETYKKVHDAGFRWAPKQALFVAPAWTPGREDVLLSLAGEIEDEDSTLAERQEARAERFTGYSGNPAVILHWLPFHEVATLNPDTVKIFPQIPDQPAVDFHRITHGPRRGIPNRPQYGPGAGRGFQNVITVADLRQHHQAITDRGRSHKKLRFSPDFSNRRGVIQPCAHQPDTFS